MTLKIVHYNDPVLRKKGELIRAFDKDLAQLAEDMVATMHEAEGIGLAAQQIGRAVQLCVVDLLGGDWEYTYTLDGAKPPVELFMPLAMVNPVVTSLPSPTDVYEEGCLSFPKIRGDVVRPLAISVKFQDLAGLPHQLTCDGMFSRCIQHEVDHLNGVLFIDRMEKKVRSELDEAISSLAKETRASKK